MKTTLLTLLLTLPVFAQERQVNVAAQYDHSPSTGHADGIGARAELVLALADKWRIVTTGIFSHQPKAYLDSGSSLRISSEARYRLIEREDVALFVSGGAAIANTSTAQYSKTVFHPTAGVGVAFGRDRYVVEWKHFFREHRTQNQGASDLVEVTAYVPLKPDSRWRIVTGIGAQRSTFKQSGVGVTAWSVRLFGGVGRVF